MMEFRWDWNCAPLMLRMCRVKGDGGYGGKDLMVWIRGITPRKNI